MKKINLIIFVTLSVIPLLLSPLDGKELKQPELLIKFKVELNEEENIVTVKIKNITESQIVLSLTSLKNPNCIYLISPQAPSPTHSSATYGGTSSLEMDPYSLVRTIKEQRRLSMDSYFIKLPPSGEYEINIPIGKFFIEKIAPILKKKAEAMIAQAKFEFINLVVNIEDQSKLDDNWPRFLESFYTPYFLFKNESPASIK